MENELNPELIAFWNKVKYHLCGNGLHDVAETYPQLEIEAGMILNLAPHAVNMATRIGDKRVGSRVNYTGKQWQNLVGQRKVTVAETPVAVAHYGEICFTIDGHILTCSPNELAFD